MGIKIKIDYFDYVNRKMHKKTIVIFGENTGIKQILAKGLAKFNEEYKNKPFTAVEAKIDLNTIGI